MYFFFCFQYFYRHDGKSVETCALFILRENAVVEKMVPRIFQERRDFRKNVNLMQQSINYYKNVRALIKTNLFN